MSPRRPVAARLWTLGLCASVLLLAVGARILWLALVEGEVWQRLSLANQHGFQELPFARGTLRDRAGRVVIEDRPGYAVRFSYLALRQGNAAALAVHAVRLAFEAGYQLDPGLPPESWSLADPPERLADAARILASLPVSWLRQKLPATARPGQIALEESLTRFLALAAGQTQVAVRKALRVAQTRPPEPSVAQAVGIDAAACRAAVADALAALDEVAEWIDWDARGRGPLREYLAGRDTLLSYRSRSPADRRRRESAAQELAADVPFEQAARILLRRERFAGFEVVHTVARTRAPEPALGFPAAELLIGSVAPGTGRRPPGLDLDDQDEEQAAEAEQLLRQALNLSEDEWGALSTTVKNRLWLAEERRARHGVRGIERDLDQVLQGRPGVRHVLRDKRGRELQEVGAQLPESGRDVTLTLDLDLQVVAERALDLDPLVNGTRLGRAHGLDAALLVMDCHSGDLLAVANRQRLTEVQEDGVASERLVEINTAAGWRDGTGRVGSVLKALFAAEALALDPELGAGFEPCQHRFASRTERGRTYSCDGTHGSWSAHGPDALATALGVSCNVFFFQVALRLGRDGVERALERFGLLPGDETGMVPGLRLATTTRETFPLEKRGIGYGVQVAPVRVLRAYAALASGFLVQPRTVLAIAGEPPLPPRRTELGLPDAAVARVRQGLLAGIAPWGTAGKNGLDRFRIAGKTGTPEFGNPRKNNAWFAGFWPMPAPRFAMVCVIYAVPDGVHGGEAAVPVVAQFLDQASADPRLARLLSLPERMR